MELGNQGALARLASVPDGGQPCHLRRQQYSIRKAKGQDSPGILACLREAFEEFRERYTPGGFLETVLRPNTLRERLEAMSVVVRSIPGSKLSARSPRAWSVSRKGIFGGWRCCPRCAVPELPRELLRRTEAELARFRCARVTLDTTEPLPRAVRFYEKHGYRRSGKTKDFFGMLLID